MTITERPYQFNWSKNDIRYVFNLTPGPLNQTAQVLILYDEAFGTSFTELITLIDLIPDADGNVYLYIQGYLNSILDYNVPDLTDTILVASSQAKKFTIHYREVSDDDPDAAWIETEEGTETVVLKGGIEKTKHSGNNFFVNYMDISIPYITWLPTKRFVYIDQPLFISFLNTGGSSIGYKLVYVFQDVAGNIYGHIDTFTEDGRVFHINVAANNPAFPTFTDPLYYMDVTVLTSDNSALTTSFRFYIEYRPVYEYWDIGYHNSLGGFDTTRIIGETTITVEKNYNETGSGKDISAWNSFMRPGNVLHGAITKRSNFKGDIGFQKTKEENEVLQEVLMTPSIWQRNSDYWIRVLNMQKGQDMRTTKTTMFSFPVQWQIASEEEVFTPMNKNFGFGT
jgi:hypothetical protein